VLNSFCPSGESRGVQQEEILRSQGQFQLIHFVNKGKNEKFAFAP